MSDAGDTFNGFDPELLSSFSYDAFDNTYVDFDVANSLGDQLVISGISLPGTYAAAVPEPTALPLVCSVLAMFSLRRRRATRFQLE